MSARESNNRTAETPTSSLGKKFNGNHPLVVVLWLSKSKKDRPTTEEPPPACQQAARSAIARKMSGWMLPSLLPTPRRLCMDMHRAVSASSESSRPKMRR